MSLRISEKQWDEGAGRVRQTESWHQRQFFSWADLYRLPPDADLVPGATVSRYLYAIPNGSHLAGDARRRAIQMRRLKEEGLTEGVSDVHFTLPRGGFHSLYLEFKRAVDDFRSTAEAQRAVSEAQWEFMREQAKLGHLCVVVYGWEVARDLVQAYVKGLIVRRETPQVLVLAGARDVAALMSEVTE